MEYSSVITNLIQIQKRIAQAAARVKRDPNQIKIVFASKGQSARAMQSICDHYANGGSQPIFGENYLQDYKKKRSEFSGECAVHFIGRLQSNKVKDVLKLFDMVETVHSHELADAINKEAAKLGKRFPVLLQVNISNDTSKSGFQVDAAIELLQDRIAQLSNIEMRGLMTITQYYESAEESRADFRAMRQLRDKIMEQSNYWRGNKNLFELSMGMSNDFEVAIEEGATIVRIGSAIFGER